MLNILEGFDLQHLGYGTAASCHLIAEALKIAFADRAAATADPDFVAVPVARLLSKAYAAERRAPDRPRARPRLAAGVPAAGESPNTTHLTVADADGRILCATHTINSLFGARFLVPELGLIPNNYMALFDPRPGHALSIAPGKRITTSQAPLIALRDGKPLVALGLPGGLRIFGSAMQALINLIDHGMTPAGGGGGAADLDPRARGAGPVEIEGGIGTATQAELRAMGHDLAVLPHVAGGMCAIGFHDDGHAGGRGLLAGGRHRHRPRRRAGAGRGALLAGCRAARLTAATGQNHPRPRAPGHAIRAAPGNGSAAAASPRGIPPA